MASEREKKFLDKPLERVADVMAGCDPTSRNDQLAKSEFLLRQTKAQISASKATEETAIYTKKYTKYMFWSVVVLAASAVGSFVLNLINR
ncbi:hypothetical protein KAW55_01280 [bacterium]|nr:hypothetical protein [bacterium]MCK4325370.1 hypothetical protein [bacterium]